MEEKAKLVVEIDGQDAKTTLQELKTESNEINRELKRMKEAGEEGSEGWKELKARQKEVNAEMGEYLHHLDVNDASMRELQNKSRLLNKELKDLKIGSEEWLAKLAEVREVDDKIDEVKKTVKGLGDEVDKQPGIWDSMKTSILAVFTGTGLLELAKSAATAIWDFGKEIFETSAKFEKYQAVLANALGDQQEAVKVMGDLKDMAAKTPFSVDELTEAYVKMVNRGLKPSMDDMIKFGDIAAASGKSFDQLTEAVLDAATGEFERLKEFGITAKKSGDEVELAFGNVHKKVAISADGIMGALKEMRDEIPSLSGAMDVVSKTMEGQLSNLGDNFDQLKLTIGEKLKPVFVGLMEAMNWGITVVKSLFDGSSELTPVFVAIGDVVGNLWGSMKSLFLTYVDGAKDSGILTSITTVLMNAIKSTATSFLLGITAVQAFYDALNVVINKGKELANFFGGNFKLDPKANFDTLQKNAEKNFASIKDMWTKTSATNVKTHEVDTKKQTATHAKSQATQTDTEKKEADKRAKARDAQAKKDKAAADKTRKAEEKAEADLVKKIEEMKVKAIKDEKARKIAEIKLSYEREKKAIEESKALEADKTTALTLLHNKMEADVASTEEIFRKKKENDEDALRKKTAAEEKRLRDEKLKQSKEMFDAEFQAEVAKAKNALDLTSENSKAQWEAKKNLLDIEYKYKIQQFKNEAEAEKARIAESIKDTDERAKAVNNIDTELKSKMSSAEQKLQTEKTKLNEEQNKSRQKNNEEFFDALKKAGDGDLKATMEFLKKKADEDKAKNQGIKEDKIKLKDAFAGLMKGDSELFQKYLSQKIKYDKDGNATQLQAFSEKTQKVADIAGQAIGALKDLNQKYLEYQLGNIKKEETEQLASWKREFDSGKISKEEFEKGNVKITEESKKRELAARKDAFEREKKMNIAAAIINTAQAALKSFAMFGWPIGAIMAVMAAVAGGIQIAAISRQQFQGARGGVVNSVGKIFARSGAIVPRNAFVAQGDAHGNSYGMGGISMINRRTGQEVGEIEGGEPVMVLSKNVYKNNGKLIDRLLHSSMYENGAPITMARGGILTSSGRRMYEDGGVVDTGVNVDGMMAENKKSQETMDRTKENTAKTAENVERLNTTMQRSQQSGGAFNAAVAQQFMRELQRHGALLTDIRNVQYTHNNYFEQLLASIASAMNRNAQSVGDVLKNELGRIKELLDKVHRERIQQAENMENRSIAIQQQQHNALQQTLWMQAIMNRDQQNQLATDSKNQMQGISLSLLQMLRNNNQELQSNVKTEMLLTREQTERHHRANQWLCSVHHNHWADVTRQNFDQESRERNKIASDVKQVLTSSDNNRHREYLQEMMLQRMIQGELSYQSVLLQQVRDKPDGSSGILHAISRLESNAKKSNL